MGSLGTTDSGFSHGDSFTGIQNPNSNGFAGPFAFGPENTQPITPAGLAFANGLNGLVVPPGDRACRESNPLMPSGPTGRFPLGITCEHIHNSSSRFVAKTYGRGSLLSPHPFHTGATERLSPSRVFSRQRRASLQATEAPGTLPATNRRASIRAEPAFHACQHAGMPNLETEIVQPIVQPEFSREGKTLREGFGESADNRQR